MAEGRPTPPPRGARRFVVIAGFIVLFMIVATFVGMNMQHAQELREQQSGQVKPADAPMHEKDLGKQPVQPK